MSNIERANRKGNNSSSSNTSSMSSERKFIAKQTGCSMSATHFDVSHNIDNINQMAKFLDFTDIEPVLHEVGTGVCLF